MTKNFEKICPVRYTLELLGGKWKLNIIYQLYQGSPKRFKELERAIPGITPAMLTKELRDLEGSGLVQREQFSTIPPTVEYRLTEYGLTLVPLIKEIRKWGKSHLGNLAAGQQAVNADG